MTTAISTPIVLPASAVASVPSAPLGPEGVSHQVLWSDGCSMAGVIRVEAGHRLGLHAHRSNDHHLWVLEGRATILDQELPSGSYAYEPCGVTHDIDATGTEGCTVFYLYVRPAP